MGRTGYFPRCGQTASLIITRPIARVWVHHSQNYGCQHLLVQNCTGIASVRLAKRHIRPNTTPPQTDEPAGFFRADFDGI